MKTTNVNWFLYITGYYKWKWEREEKEKWKKFKELSAKDKDTLERDVRHGILDYERWKKIRLTLYGRLWFFLKYDIWDK